MRHTVVGSVHGGADIGIGGGVDAGVGAGAVVGSTAGTVVGSTAGTAGTVAGSAGLSTGAFYYGVGYIGGLNYVPGSTAGTAAGVAGSSAGGTGGSAVGTGVAVDQSGSSVPYSITLSDVFRAGTVEGAAHIIARGQLLHNVSGLHANQIVNAIYTLSGKKRFDLADWTALGSACQAGQFDLGFVDPAGNVPAMYKSDGTAWVKAINAEGSLDWVNLTNPATTNTEEIPEIIESRLGAIAKAAQTQLGVSNFMCTDRAWHQYTAPRVLETGSIQVENPVGYAGVTALLPLPKQQFQLVASGKIKPGDQ